MTIIHFDLEQNFFEVFPELKAAFANIVEQYGENASKIMWCIALDTHPKSAYRNLETDSRRRILEEDYYGEPIDWNSIQEYISLFRRLCLTKRQRYLVEWEEKLDERQTYIASLEYNERNYEMLDKLMSATEKMWKQYLTSLKDVEEEESSIIGGAQESLAEQGLI